jgi:transcription-repair coupling factor (superfamily II helicase)
MRDLEIRGAGNILGPQQSGHIATVGYDLYCRLLGHAVAKRRQEPILEPPDVDILVDVDAYIPEEYIPHQGVRFQVYRRFASVTSDEDLQEIRDELRDRFGAPPPPVEGLFLLAGLRLAAGAMGISALVRQDDGLEIRHARSDRLAPFRKRLPYRLAHLDDRTALIPYAGENLDSEDVCRHLLGTLVDSPSDPR